MPNPDTLTQIGKYRVLELVGEGAMGIVYRATDTVLERTVALKVMSDAIARQEDLRERFLREAQAAGSLQHPNVVTIFDFGEVDGHLYIAMEFVDGVDLETVLEERQALTLDARLGVIIDLLTGLAYAHKRGIVHRDVKPANIRLTDDGRAKIMDFGIVHLTSSNMTRTGMMMGTPSYMAPEQVTGGKVTPATDIFAAGVVLYELLTGAKPFDGPTLHSILFKIVSEEPRDVLTLVPSLPLGISRIVNRALAKDAAARYGSALEMANELSVVRSGVSGGAGSGTLSLRASFAQRNAATNRRERATAHARRVAQWGGGALATAAAVATIWTAVATRRAVERDGLGGTPNTASLTSTENAPSGTSAPAATPARTTHASPASSTTMDASVLPVTSATPRRSGATTIALPAASSHGAPPPPPAPPSLGGRHDAAVQPLASAPRTALTATPAGNDQRAASPATQPVAPVQAAPPAAPAANAASSAAGVSDAIAAYARAIQSRDVGAIRRVYPDISGAQAHGFEQFFDATRSLRVTFSIASLDVSGTSADARVVGAYDYTGADGRAQRQPVSFRATLRQDGGSWRLIAVQ